MLGLLAYVLGCHNTKGPFGFVLNKHKDQTCHKLNF